MKIAILTSPNQWFIPFATTLNEQLLNADLFFAHEDIDTSYETVFILSYHRIIEKTYLEQHKHNIVIHASALPQGKGWAPMFWQILEGKNDWYGYKYFSELILKNKYKFHLYPGGGKDKLYEIIRIHTKSDVCCLVVGIFFCWK